MAKESTNRNAVMITSIRDPRAESQSIIWSIMSEFRDDSASDTRFIDDNRSEPRR
jgi:hypothetical protein